MAESKSALGSVADGVSGIFQQVGQFFHIFDLSFFASGAATFGAFAFAAAYFHISLPPHDDAWITAAVFVLGSYICGVASFAVGRKFRARSRWRRNLHEKLPLFLKSHGLFDDPVIATYFTGDGTAAEQNEQAFRLYSRLWAELRDDHGASESFRMLNRYWVTSAMYDGLIVSFLVWAGTMLTVGADRLLAAHWLLGALLCITAVAFVLLARACYQEGDRNFQYQVSELVATFAAYRRKIVPQAAQT